MAQMVLIWENRAQEPTKKAMASQGQPSDLEDIQMEYLAKTWANINGGRLWTQAVNKLAQVRNNEFEEDEILFNASEEEFLKHGETKLEHLRWRQLELYELCERAAYYMTRNINKNDQGEDYLDIHERDYDIDESREMSLTEPRCKWNCLEAAVTDWYLKTKKGTSFILPNPKEAKNGSQYASVRYYEWEQENGSIETNISLTQEEEKAQKDKNNSIINRDSKPTWDDLEPGEIDKKAASKQIQNWMKEDKNKISRTLDEIETALKSSSRRASEKHNKGKGEEFPIQLDYNPDYGFKRLAMVHQGGQGRGNSARYRIIKVPNVDN